MKTRITETLKSAKKSGLALLVMTMATSTSFANDLSSHDLNQLIDQAITEAKIISNDLSTQLQVASLETTMTKARTPLIIPETGVE